jgi:hypothetical protein
MKKHEAIVARLARGATTASLAACLIPQTHTVGERIQSHPQEVPFTTVGFLPMSETLAGTGSGLSISVLEDLKEWNKRLEKEFRGLALLEAKGTISVDESKRLNWLSRQRDRLVCPQTAEEYMLQRKRDRLLAKTAELLNEYVEFQRRAG